MLESLPQQSTLAAAPTTGAKALNAKTAKDGAQTQAETRSFAKALDQANADQSGTNPTGGAKSAQNTATQPAALTLPDTAAGAETPPTPMSLDQIAADTGLTGESELGLGDTALETETPELADQIVPAPINDTKTVAAKSLDLAKTQDTGEAPAPQDGAAQPDTELEDISAEELVLAQIETKSDGAEAVAGQISVAAATKQSAPLVGNRPTPQPKTATPGLQAKAGAEQPSANAGINSTEAGAPAPSRYSAQVDGDSALDEKLLMGQNSAPSDKIELKSTTASFEKLLAAQTETNPADPALAITMPKAPSADIAAAKPLPEVMVQVPQQRAEMAAKQVGLELARQAKNGDTHFVIRMDPPELGKLDVRLTINKAGEVQASIMVDREATLDLLARDTRGLERSLQDAGLKFDQSALNLGLKNNNDNESGQSMADAGGTASSGADDELDGAEEIIDGAALAQIQLASGRPLDVVI